MLVMCIGLAHHKVYACRTPWSTSVCRISSSASAVQMAADGLLTPIGAFLHKAARRLRRTTSTVMHGDQQVPAIVAMHAYDAMLTRIIASTYPHTGQWSRYNLWVLITRSFGSFSLCSAPKNYVLFQKASRTRVALLYAGILLVRGDESPNAMQQMTLAALSWWYYRKQKNADMTNSNSSDEQISGQLQRMYCAGPDFSCAVIVQLPCIRTIQVQTSRPSTEALSSPSFLFRFSWDCFGRRGHFAFVISDTEQVPLPNLSLSWN